jgi:hypothetical protein
MSREIPVDALMFGVAEVPIAAVVKTGETIRNITVPGKKALIHEGSGKILGVVILSASPRTIDGWIARRMIPFIEPNPPRHLFDAAAAKSVLLAQFAVLHEDSRWMSSQ